MNVHNRNFTLERLYSIYRVHIDLTKFERSRLEFSVVQGVKNTSRTLIIYGCKDTNFIPLRVEYILNSKRELTLCLKQGRFFHFIHSVPIGTYCNTVRLI